MWSTINFKSVSCRPGAFFNQLHLHIKVSTLKVQIGKFEAHSFVYDQQTALYQHSIGVKVKVPAQSKQATLLFEPSLMNIDTQCEQINIKIPKTTKIMRVEVQSDLGFFNVQLCIEEQKYMRKLSTEQDEDNNESGKLRKLKNQQV